MFEATDVAARTAWERNPGTMRADPAGNASMTFNDSWCANCQTRSLVKSCIQKGYGSPGIRQRHCVAPTIQPLVYSE